MVSLMGKQYTVEEKEIIRDNYPDFQKILLLLPQRTKGGIREQARQMGLTQKPHWSKTEIKSLKVLYPRAPRERIKKKLPGRTWLGIQAKVKRLEITRFYRWTTKEIRVLKKKYPYESKERILKLIHRPWQCICLKARKLKIHRAGCYWTDWEDTILKKHYPKSKKEKILKLLPWRTWISISTRARKRKIRRLVWDQCRYGYSGYKKIYDWSAKEISTLTECYPKDPWPEIESKLPNKSRCAIGQKAATLKLHRPRSLRWNVTKMDMRWIVALVKKGCNLKKIAKILAKDFVYIKEGYKIRVWHRKRGVYTIDFSPTENLTYVLGVLKGDGNIQPSGKTWETHMRVKDKIFTVSFCKALHRLGFRWTKVENYITHKGNYYRCDLNDKLFGAWYCRVSLPKLIGNNKSRIRAFLRGIYESEGCPGNGARDKTFYPSISNTDKNLIDFVEQLIRKLGYRTSRIVKDYTGIKGKSHWKTLYEIYVRGKNKEKIKFLREIKPCIKLPSFPLGR